MRRDASHIPTNFAGTVSRDRAQLLAEAKGVTQRVPETRGHTGGQRGAAGPDAKLRGGGPGPAKAVERAVQQRDRAPQRRRGQAEGPVLGVDPLQVAPGLARRVQGAEDPAEGLHHAVVAKLHGVAKVSLLTISTHCSLTHLWPARAVVQTWRRRSRQSSASIGVNSSP